MKKLEDMTEPELRQLMNATGKAIEYAAEVCDVEKPMFVVVLFNDPKVAQYAANCERADVIKAMRETADRLANREHVER
jgi:hypothetical protein